MCMEEHTREATLPRTLRNVRRQCECRGERLPYLESILSGVTSEVSTYQSSRLLSSSACKHGMWRDVRGEHVPVEHAAQQLGLQTWHAMQRPSMQPTCVSACQFGSLPCGKMGLIMNQQNYERERAHETRPPITAPPIKGPHSVQ